jgi:Flp pilus assembly protein TadD
MSTPARFCCPRSQRLLALAAFAVVLGGMLGGCQTTGITGTTTEPAATAAMASARTETDWRREVAIWGERSRANPNDPVVAMNYAQALRNIGQRAQAVAVLEAASIQNANNMVLLGAYGRALADNGNFQQALDVLNRAHTPERPDWRVLSVQGAVLDQMGRPEEAQRYYTTALRIKPDEPSVLSNLGLSYALAKDLVQAEATLRRAAAGLRVDARVRQNLALVVALQGRFAEAETIAAADLPPEEAAANIAYLKQMMAQQQQQKTAPAKRTTTAKPA